MTGRSILPLAGVLLCTAVVGCASEGSWLETVMVVPGYYDTLECRDIVNQVKGQAGRIKELSELIEKSGHGVAGSVVNVMAYQTDLAKAHATYDAAERASKRKGCDESDKPGSPAAAPANPPSAGAKPPRH